MLIEERLSLDDQQARLQPREFLFRLISTKGIGRHALRVGFVLGLEYFPHSYATDAYDLADHEVLQRFNVPKALAELERKGLIYQHGRDVCEVRNYEIVAS